MVVVVEAETVGVALLLVGLTVAMLYLGYRGVVYLGQGWTIWRNEPIDAGSVHLESGIVEVQGEAEPIDGGVVESRYTGTPSLAYEYELEEKQRDRDPDGNTEWEWKTVDSGTVAQPFYVSDETGQVAVEPDGATVTLDSERVSSSNHTREYEGRLEPGDFVSVYGQKREATDGEAPGEESVFVGDGSETDAFTVSDTTQFRTFLRFAAKGGGMLVLALAILGLNAFLSMTFLEQLGMADFGIMSFGLF